MLLFYFFLKKQQQKNMFLTVTGYDWWSLHIKDKTVLLMATGLQPVWLVSIISKQSDMSHFNASWLAAS